MMFRALFGPGPIVALAALAMAYPVRSQSRDTSIAWIDSIPPGREWEALERDFASMASIMDALDLDISLLAIDRFHPRLRALYLTYAEMAGLLPRWKSDGRAEMLPQVERFKERTERIHRLLDAGETDVGQRLLKDMIRHAREARRRFQALSAHAADERGRTR